MSRDTFRQLFSGELPPEEALSEGLIVFEGHSEVLAHCLALYARAIGRGP